LLLSPLTGQAQTPGASLGSTVYSAAGDNLVDILVKFENSDFNLDDLGLGDRQIYARQLFQFSSSPELKKIFRITFAADEPAQSLVSKILRVNGVVWAQTDEKVSVALDTNDEFYTKDIANINAQWYLPKISAAGGWDIQNQAGGVLVAVVDTGIDALHQDLKDGRVTAGYQVYCSQVDETNNNCLNRTRGDIPVGINSDDNSHGTSVTSIIGAITGNFAGIAGVAWTVKLMPVKVLNKDGIGTASDVAEGIVWAAEHDAKIINLSLGATTLTDAAVLQVATDIAYQKGAIVVAAAGNDHVTGTDLDIAPSSPVCSDGANNNVLGVAALDFNDQKASFSNYGANCIDISAPGVRMLSAYFDPSKPEQQNVYAYRSGTSFAAPLVSGAVALLKAKEPGLTMDQIKTRIISTADDINGANLASCNGGACGNKLGGGRLNLQAVLSGTTVVPPPPPPIGTNIQEGDVIKLANSSELYLINGGVKRWLLPLVASQRGIDTANPKELSEDDFGKITLGKPMPPVDGSLIRGDASLAVFIMKDGVKQPLSYLSFVSHNFSFGNVLEMPQNFVSSLDLGTLYPPKEGTLVRANNDLTVYIIRASKKQAMTYLTFTSHNFSFTNVLVVDPASVSNVSTGLTYLPASGTLIRPSDSFTVYLSEAIADGPWQLHALNFEAFTSRNFEFKNVKIVTPQEFKLYEYALGEAYLK